MTQTGTFEELRSFRARARNPLDARGNGFHRDAVPSRHHFIWRKQSGVRWVLAAHLINATIEAEREAYAGVLTKFGLWTRPHLVRRVTTDHADHEAAWRQLEEMEFPNVE